MKMKKWIGVMLCVLMVVGLSACQKTSKDSVSDTQVSVNKSGTIKDGTLMVGMEIGYPPMEYLDTDGKTAIGFDVELAKQLADKMGLKLKIVDTSWDGIFAGVDTGKYDCIISSVSITDDRKKHYNFSDAYVANRQVLVVPVDSDINSLTDLKGHSTAVQGETTADDYMKKHATEIGCELKEYDKILNCFDDLKLKRADSVFVDSVVAAYYLGDDKDKYHTVWQNDDVEPLGVCLKKGNTTLTDKINATLKELNDDGTMKQISEKYFGDDISTDASKQS